AGGAADLLLAREGADGRAAVAAAGANPAAAADGARRVGSAGDQRAGAFVILHVAGLALPVAGAIAAEAVGADALRALGVLAAVGGVTCAAAARVDERAVRPLARVERDTAREKHQE